VRGRTAHKEEQIARLHLRVEDTLMASGIATVIGRERELRVMAARNCSTRKDSTVM
jgi:hypothetical protein